MDQVVATAKLKNLRVSPRKVRLVADLVRGLHTTDALAQLGAITNRSSDPIAKLIESALANAKDRDLNTNNLVIGKITVDKGLTLKRTKPRARGRATIIEKKMSHVQLELVEKADKSSKFVMPEKEVKVKKEDGVQKETPKPKVEDALDAKAKERKGITKRVFQRKSV